MVHLITLYLMAVASMCVHEAAHAVVADQCGDRTPRRAGRLTLNPYMHLRFLGLGFHPMPLDATRLGPDRFAAVIVAGPLANLGLALVGALAGWPTFAAVNLALTLFNLLPVKPLDGYHLAQYILTFHLENPDGR